MPSSAEPQNRPRASVIGSIVQGWSRALHAPWVAAGMLAVTILVVFKLQAAAIPADISILPAPNPLTDWIRMFISEIAMFGDRILITGRLLRGEPVEPSVFAYVVVSAALWVFLSGGVIDRLARARPVGAGLFFWACGAYAGRFVRLALLFMPIYWAIFRWAPPGWTVLALIGLVSVVLDFTMVRVVVEDRRSVPSALVAALRFIRRRLLRVVTLYLAGVMVVAALPELLFTAATGRLTPSFAVVSVYVVLLVRTWAMLALTASEVAFFQGELAHAHYTAAPPPVWPDSPAVEAIDNLQRLGRLSGPRRDADGSR